ncbi:MAG TPA: lytic transglycosylase domain-containing protein [Candidatus Angelobacter sp.]|nr:lytic transglycosylase domain-containing protein [Candidatus Angelobacter sp.]
MRFLRPITIAAGLLLAQLSAFGGEIAVLRNGFSIHFEHKEQTGNLTRLYTGTGYLDISTDQIASYEAEETPIAPQLEVKPDVSPQPQIQAATAPATTPVSTQPVTVAAATPQNVDLDQVVREAALKNRLDPDFVSSVIRAESNFKVHAVSKKGAQGLMQLMPGTAAQLGVADPFDPKANIEAGAAHLSALLDLYHNDAIKALAAYNAGALRVKQYHGVPPYRETRAYVSKIVRDFNSKKLAQKKAAAATAKTAATVKPATASKTANTKAAKKPKSQQASVTKPGSPA